MHVSISISCWSIRMVQNCDFASCHPDDQKTPKKDYLAQISKGNPVLYYKYFKHILFCSQTYCWLIILFTKHNYKVSASFMEENNKNINSFKSKIDFHSYCNRTISIFKIFCNICLAWVFPQNFAVVWTLLVSLYEWIYRMKYFLSYNERYWRKACWFILRINEQQITIIFRVLMVPWVNQEWWVLMEKRWAYLKYLYTTFHIKHIWQYGSIERQLGPIYMIPLNRDEIRGGIILMYWNKSRGLNESSHHQ